MIDFVARFVAALSDTELAYIKQVVYDEDNERVTNQVKSGNFLPLNREELQLVKTNQIMAATRSYRKRTGVELRIAYKMMQEESHRQHWEE